MIIFQERGAKVSTNQQSTPQTHQLHWQHTNAHIMPANELISTYMPPFSTDTIKKKKKKQKEMLPKLRLQAKTEPSLVN